MSQFNIGDKVYTGVHVGGKWQRMAPGIVTQIFSGYYEVDIMGLHGGNPWKTTHTHLEAFTDDAQTDEKPTPAESTSAIPKNTR